MSTTRSLEDRLASWAIARAAGPRPTVIETAARRSQVARAGLRCGLVGAGGRVWVLGMSVSPHRTRAGLPEAGRPEDGRSEADGSRAGRPGTTSPGALCRRARDSATTITRAAATAAVAIHMA